MSQQIRWLAVGAAVLLGVVAIYSGSGASADPPPRRNEKVREPEAQTKDHEAAEGVWIFARGRVKMAEGEMPKLVAGNVQLPLRFPQSIQPEVVPADLIRLQGYLIPGGGSELDKRETPWVCMVTAVASQEEADVNPKLVDDLRKHKQMIVKYRPGRNADVERKCRELGLNIVDRHGAGQFIVCSWPEGIDLPRTLSALLENPGVEYVEPNFVISIDPLEQPRRHAQRQ